MQKYNHILYVTNFSSSPKKNIPKLKEISTNTSAKVSLLQVLRPLHHIHDFTGVTHTLEKKIKQNRKDMLLTLCQNNKLPVEDVYIEFGNVFEHIKRASKTNHCDAIYIIPNSFKSYLESPFHLGEKIYKDSHCDVLVHQRNGIIDTHFCENSLSFS